MKDETPHEETPDFREFNSLNPSPMELEHDIVQRLKKENLIRETVKPVKFFWAAAATVAIAAAFFAGRYLPVAGSEGNQLSYLLLLREDSSFVRTGQADYVKEYGQWASDLRARHQLTSAEKLASQAVELGRVSIGADSEITGYFIIQAASLEDATTIALSHPHLRYNGGIELRPIEKLKR